MNCVPHYDPGLLSISFLSTHEGLQLKDPTTGTWFAGKRRVESGGKKRQIGETKGIEKIT